MAKFHVDITQRLYVEIDETKFTPEWLADFRKTFYNFQSVQDHVEHLARLEAAGIIHTQDRDCFIEGYGPAGNFKLQITKGKMEIDSCRRAE
jgi:hypothetical protein